MTSTPANDPSALVARARAHLADEPSEADRRTIEHWLDSSDVAALARAFATPLEFGTAGLRAAVHPGPSGMNVRNVVRAARAVLEVVASQFPDARDRGVVVGFDARPTSAAFADAIRAVASHAGFRVHAFDVATPTPLVAYAANRLGAVAAFVVTASHNPPGDNGLKVYGPDAAQIVPPFDSLVASRMHDARPTELPSDPVAERIVPIDTSIVDAYVAGTVALGATTRPRAPVRIAYTAVHGVGAVWVERTLAALGNVALHPVVEQHAPDGLFPTTPKPNPEEPGALARVLDLAHEVGADLAIATDPDGDRLAAALRHGDDFVVLHGDELGVLLGTALVERASGPSPFVLATLVSSPWLAEWASARGVHAETTATGHKWIAARALALASEGRTFVFGYEEALGYAFANGVRDKDGIAAATFLARLASEEAAAGSTLLERLERVARDGRMHRSRLATRRFEGPDAKRAMDAAVAAFSHRIPETLAGVPVRARIDGARGVVVEGDRERPLGARASSLFGVVLEGDVRILLRPSGTEPKLKIYFDLPLVLPETESYVAARTRADAELDRLEAAFAAELGS